MGTLERYEMLDADRGEIEMIFDYAIKQRREQVEKLKLYTTHLDNCNYWANRKCNCGLEPTLKELEVEGE